MQLQVYRIDRSISGRIGHFFKKPNLPLAMPETMMGKGLIGNPLQVLRDVSTTNCFILTKDDDIARFRNPLNQTLVDDVYYVRHPQQARTNWLIPAKSFHRYVIREQIADIVSYIRANAAVKRLHVSITNGLHGKVGAKAIVEGLAVEGDAHVSFTDSHDVTIECGTPLKSSQKRRDYVWMEHFPTTVAAVDQFADGTIDIDERFDFNAGLDAKVADMLDIGAEFRRSYHYHVRCEFA